MPLGTFLGIEPALWFTLNDACKGLFLIRYIVSKVCSIDVLTDYIE